MTRAVIAERVLPMDKLGLPRQTFRAEVLQNSRGQLLARLAVDGARPDGGRWETAHLELSLGALRAVAAALEALADDVHAPRRVAA